MIGGLLSSVSSGDDEPDKVVSAADDVAESPGYRYHFILDVNIPGSRRRALTAAYEQDKTNAGVGIDGEARFPADIREQFRSVVANVLEDMDASLLALRTDGDTTPAQAHLAVATPRQLDTHRFKGTFTRTLEAEYNHPSDARNLHISRVQSRGFPATIDERFPLPAADEIEELAPAEVKTLVEAHGLPSDGDRRTRRDRLLLLRAVDEQDQED